MATLQARNVPDDVYAAARVRAQANGMSLSEYVIDVLRREVARPTLREWVAQARLDVPSERLDVDVEALIDAVRAEHDA